MRWRERGAVMLGLALLATCSPPSTPPDGEADASLDASRAADAHDARPDTSALDAQQDTSVDDADAASPFGWTHLGGVPDQCDLRVALHPELTEPFVWADCGPGCEYLPHGSGVVRGLANDDGRTFYDSLEWVDGHDVRALFDHDGTCIGVWTAYDDLLPGRLCGIDAIAVGGGRAAVAGHAWIQGHPELSTSLIWVAAIEDVGHTVEPSIRFGADVGNLPQRLWVSATHVVVQTSLGLTRMSDGSTLGPPVFVTADDGPAQDGFLYADQFSFEAWQPDRVRLALATYGSSPAEILRAADPGDVRGFGSDGRDMAWLQGYDYDVSLGYARMELWTAPYPTSTAAFTPRFVREIPSILNRAAVGGGWYVKQAIGGGFDAWSLADGMQRTWTPPTGVVEDGGPHYALAHEVFVRTNSLPYRIDPSTLPIVP